LDDKNKSVESYSDYQQPDSKFNSDLQDINNLYEKSKINGKSIIGDL